MSHFISVFCLLSGFALLVLGADWFVSGASGLARRLCVPPLVVGLTVVAFGTSAPELAVSVTAALRGANEIAVGNITGSNIFNLLVVAGASAVLCPLTADRTLLRRDWPCSAAAAALLSVLLWTGGGLSRIEGLVLLVLFGGLLYTQLRGARSAADTRDAPETHRPGWTLVLLLAVGIVCIVAGGELAVRGATGLARAFGWSESLIGLTIVAIGTSLPELVTSLVAAHRGENDIALGNVIGSNLFNILCILGLSSVICPIPVAPAAVLDAAILTAVSVIFYRFARKGGLSRPAGTVMLLTYAAYTAFLILRG